MTLLSFLATTPIPADPASMKLWAYIGFIGIKLLLLATPPYFNDMGLSASEIKSIKIDPFVSLVIVLGTLVVATVMSVLIPNVKDEKLV